MHRHNLYIPSNSKKDLKCKGQLHINMCCALQEIIIPMAKELKESNGDSGFEGK